MRGCTVAVSELKTIWSRNGDGISLEKLSAIVQLALEAMQTSPYEPFKGAKKIFPQIWCEWGSIAIAELLQHRGLGEWTFVAHGNDSGSGHAWLEQRETEGALIYTIDATIHQFPEWAEPYVGFGDTPAAQKFPSLRFRGAWRDWPGIANDETYARYSAALLGYLDAQPMDGQGA